MIDLSNIRLVIFDCDGTLTTTQSGAKFRKTADDWEILPGRVEKLSDLRSRDIRLSMASNQGGVGCQYLKQEDMLRELQNLAKALMIPAGGVYICYTHPYATLEPLELYRVANDPRRKPNPGMLLEAIGDFEASPEQTLFVGDRNEDRDAAKNAGCAFMWTKDFFEESDVETMHRLMHGTDYPAF